MYLPDVNVIAIIVASLASMVTGALWYGPMFGKKWMELSGMSIIDIKKGNENGMVKEYLLMLLGSVVTAYVLSVIILSIGLFSIYDGAMIGFWVWLGFVAPMSLSSVLWEKKSWSLWILNNAYWLITLKIMASIIAVWR